MRWTTKAMIQRTLATIPGGELVYYLGQRSVGGFRRFTIDSKVRQATSLLQALFEAGEVVEGRSALEIGTGWAPVVPLVFWAYGQARCDTYDVSALLKDRLLAEALDQLCGRCAEMALTAAGPGTRDRVAGRLRWLRGAAGSVPARQMLEHCGIRYHGASDAARTGLPDRSVDLVYSNVVLEHVSGAEIDRLFVEARRVLRPGGCMVHLIDPSDHFSHGDASISPINFLQFSDAEFARFNSVFLFQNRLRAPSWRDRIERHRFAIKYWRTVVDSRSLGELPSLGIDDAFSRFDPEELCTTAVWVVAQRLD